MILMIGKADIFYGLIMRKENMSAFLLDKNNRSPNI